MARTWTALYGSICTSKKLRACANDASRVFYLLLLTQADPWGRAEDDAETLCARVWPLLGKSEKDTEKALTDLASCGLIARYVCDATKVVQILDWESHAGRHQGGSRGSPSFPEPPRVSPSLPESPRVSPDSSGTSGEIRSPYISSLSPSPSESRKESDERKPSRTVRIDPETYPLPATLDFPDVRQALVDYLTTRKDGIWNEALAAVRLKELATWGRERAIAALRHSVGYQGLFEPTTPKNGRPIPPPLEASPYRPL